MKNDKKSSVEPCQVGEREREKYEKSFEKVFESVKTLFLKNLNHDVRLIENQIGSIEILEKQLFRKNNLIFESLPQSIECKI